MEIQNKNRRNQFPIVYRYGVLIAIVWQLKQRHQ